MFGLSAIVVAVTVAIQSVLQWYVGGLHRRRARRRVGHARPDRRRTGLAETLAPDPRHRRDEPARLGRRHRAHRPAHRVGEPVGHRAADHGRRGVVAVLAPGAAAARVLVRRAPCSSSRCGAASSRSSPCSPRPSSGALAVAPGPARRPRAAGGDRVVLDPHPAHPGRRSCSRAPGSARRCGRGWRLTRGSFWRLLGIYLLTSIMVGDRRLDHRHPGVAGQRVPAARPAADVVRLDRPHRHRERHRLHADDVVHGGRARPALHRRPDAPRGPGRRAGPGRRRGGLTGAHGRPGRPRRRDRPRVGGPRARRPDLPRGPEPAAAAPRVGRLAVRRRPHRPRPAARRWSAGCSSSWSGWWSTVAFWVAGPVRARVAGRPRPWSSSGDDARTAAELRAAADAAAARGDWSTAVLERFRAVVRSLEERALLDDRPGRTAHEAAEAAAARLPARAAELRRAARLFDDVCYGARRGGRGRRRLAAHGGRRRRREPASPRAPGCRRAAVGAAAGAPARRARRRPRGGDRRPPSLDAGVRR